MRGFSRVRTVAVVAVLALGACGVSKPYVAANARTIYGNADMLIKALDGCKPIEGAEPESCSLPTVAVEQLRADAQQVQERARGLCKEAQSDCAKGDN